MNCNCPVCQGRDYNTDGLKLAEDEVIPFIKKYIIKMRFINAPFPLRYEGLFASVLCYSQALAFDKAHNKVGIFYTENKWMLKFSTKLESKFGMSTKHKNYLPNIYSVACECNVLDNEL